MIFPRSQVQFYRKRRFSILGLHVRTNKKVLQNRSQRILNTGCPKIRPILLIIQKICQSGSDFMKSHCNTAMSQDIQILDSTCLPNERIQTRISTCSPLDGLSSENRSVNQKAIFFPSVCCIKEISQPKTMHQHIKKHVLGNEARQRSPRHKRTIAQSELVDMT